MKKEKRGPGRPRVPDSERVRIHGIAMRPAVIEALRKLSARTTRTQASLIEEAVYWLKEQYARRSR